MALVCAWIASPAAAAAQPSEVDRDAARALVQRGDEKRDRGDVKGALDAYIQADAIMGVPTTSIEVANMHLELDQLMEAYEALRRTVKHPQKDREPAPFTRARKKAKKLLKALKKRIPRLTIDVVGISTETLPLVVIDGELVDGLNRRGVNPGKHEVVAAAEGFVSQTQTVELAEGDDKTIFFELVPEEMAPDTVAPKPEGLPTFPMIVGGFGLATAGVVVGAITGGLSLGEASELDSVCGPEQPDGMRGCAPRYEGVLDRSRTFATVSTTFFALAAVGAGVGIFGLVMHQKKEDAEEPSETPTARIDVHPTGMTLTMRW